MKIFPDWHKYSELTAYRKKSPDCKLDLKMRILWKCHRKKIKCVLLKLFLSFSLSNQNHVSEKDIEHIWNVEMCWTDTVRCSVDLYCYDQEVNFSLVIIPDNPRSAPKSMMKSKHSWPGGSPNMILTFSLWREFETWWYFKTCNPPHLLE